MREASAGVRLVTEALKTTPLTPAHLARGARMVPFGGYSMPVQYADGVLKLTLPMKIKAATRKLTVS